jgi:hypothetical protein
LPEFSELIKNLSRVRAYIRDFYLFGWRTRTQYNEKSPRSYDNERRRIESWLNEYVRRKYVQAGKNVSIAVDMKDLPRNPLYEVWRTKSFTRNDILLHFFILDILSDGCVFTAEEATDEINSKHGELFDVSTVRNKLREYEREGLLSSSQEGKRIRYALSMIRWEDMPRRMGDAVDFFTEAAPFGEIGGYIQDEAGRSNPFFRFKHHFIVHTLEDEVLLNILEAMKDKRRVTLRMAGSPFIFGVPLRILVSVQNGRRYVVMKRDKKGDKFSSQRLDKIERIDLGEVVPEYDEIGQEFERVLENAWGVTFRDREDSSGENKLEYVSIRLYIDEKSEMYVLDRLKREGRRGTVEREAENLYVYKCSVWNAAEMLPFVKSFTGRIVSFQSDGRMAVKRFYEDMKRMYEMYVTEEADENAR